MEILETNYSISKPGKEYHIIRGTDGVIYCDCWQWKTKRDCIHLRNYLANHGNYGLKTEPTKTEVKKGSIEDDIDNVINSFFPR